jgi:enoyl-CoA hydratase
MDDPFTSIGVFEEGDIARLEFQRPDQHNAFDETMHNEFARALAALRQNIDIRVVLLHAQGKSFIGGGNFDYLRALHRDADLRRRTCQEAYDIFTLLNDMPMPVIAAVQGPALGLGATIVTSCDIIVAWEGATLGDPHVRAGIVAGDGGVLSWSAAAGTNRAKRMLLTGDLITAREAFSFGLVTDLVDSPEKAYPTARAIAERIAALPPLAVRGTKQVFNVLGKNRNSVALDASILAEDLSLASDDLEEAMAALAEKRPGKFRAR